MQSPSPLLRRLLRYPIATDVAIIGPDGVGGGAGTYGAIGARARALAAALLSLHQQDRVSLDGARIAFLAPPGRAYVDALFAIWIAGGTAVPLSPLHTAPELAHVVSDATPEALLATAELVPRLDTLKTGLRVLTLDDSLPLSFSPNAPVAAEHPALILYTSGTTGRPKGVVLSHANLAATLASLEQAWEWRRADRLLHVLPLHHTHGVIVALLGALWAGATTRFAPFEPIAAWELLSESTVFMAVPTVYSKLMHAFASAPPDRQQRWALAARTLRLATSGSAALSPALFAAFEAATGGVIVERYGMTEIGMALSNPLRGARIAGSVGVPLPGVLVDIVLDNETPAPAGEPGELRVQSPQVFSGYHGNADATAESFDAKGRFRTGDTGVVDQHGVVRLMGRRSVDILKSGGYKISAVEIEQTLSEHPAIAEVAVIGIPDEVWGDAVTACAVLRAGHELTVEELRSWAKDRLAPYKVPRALRVLSSLPRNAMGKLQKKLLHAL